jgi:hypothetical protein
LIAEQRDYDQNEQSQLADEAIPMLNEEQREAFDKITTAVVERTPKLYFLNGPAGTGKTFVYKTLCYSLRGQGKIVLCVASSGIAALPLPGGRTSHSMFKIPIEIYDGKACSIKRNTALGDFIMEVDLIIWDEVPMQSKLCQEAVDLTLQDIRSSSLPFGGITVVFGGDFQQILPVVVKGGREETVSLCISRSKFWHNVERLKLTRNMRLDNASQEERDFAAWLLDVGHGRHPLTRGDQTISLPATMKCALGNTIGDLVTSIYPGLPHLTPRTANSNNVIERHNYDEFFMDRTILSSRNESVHEVNSIALERFPGEKKVLHSVDFVQTEQGVDDNELQAPVEFLNSINASGLPLSKLELKIGCPVMILRNMSAKDGVCNGTRAILTRATNRVLEIRVMSGQHNGKKAFIPRILCEPSPGELPFILKRRQFPVRLCFGMTINKSQGQSVKHVGIDLRNPVFAHGQLYVALSRCTSSSRIKVVFTPETDDCTTGNIVYPEVLQ